MTTVLQSMLPAPLWCEKTAQRLPGIQPLALDDWLWLDDAYAGQMALRDQLIAERRCDVVALNPAAEAAARELLDVALSGLGRLQGYEILPDLVVRPDGVEVVLDRDDPLGVAGRLVQEDLCLMQAIDGQYVLTGAVLCFPAGWTLAEKIGRPLVAIHVPVAAYTADISRRVDRLFSAIRVEQPLWRVNGFYYDNPALFAPFREAEPRPPSSDNAGYFRAERQCFLRLEASKAVVFSIHTFVVERSNLTPAQMRLFQDRGAGQ